MRLRVFDWNVYDKNKLPPEEIVRFIFSHDADVVFLQEVSQSVLDVLVREATGRYECIAGKDFRSAERLCYLVTLTRLPALYSKAVRAREKKGWRSFFSSFWYTFEEHLESLRVDIKAGERKIKTLNLHLEVGTGPKNRLKQFRHALWHGLRRFMVRNAIIAGDLNIYGEKWYPRFVGWLWFGLPSPELLMDERKEFERLFKKRGLVNVFKGETTFIAEGLSLIVPIFPSAQFQFDHILVPHGTKIVSRVVIKDMHGSDHFSVLAEVEFK